MSTPKDKDELVLNPVTGELDMVRKFNADRIVTAKLNAAGTVFQTYDPESGTFIDDGPRVVIDNDGNVVVT